MNLFHCILVVDGVLASGLSAQTFGAVESTPVPGLSVAAIGLVDADGDGRLDVIVAPRGNSVVHTIVGDGAGGFGAVMASSLAYGMPTDSAAFFDATADGRVDVVVSGGVVQAGVRLMSGDGAGGFVQGPSIAGLPLTFHGMKVDADEHPDLVGIGNFGGVLSVAFGAPGGGFRPAVAVAVGVPMPFFPRDFVSGDVDGDGDEDLLVGLPPVVMLSDGAGGFPLGSQLPVQAQLPRALGDFDGDGRLDLLAQDSQGVVRLFRNDGFGSFEAPSFVLSGQNSFLRVVRTADVDGDGQTDVLIATGSSIQVWRGDGAGGFAGSEVVSVGALDDFQVGDLDADGRVEIVAAGAEVVHVVRRRQSTSIGLVGYGFGTPTCRGTIGITGNRPPHRGATDFRVQCTNAPADTTGLLLAGTKVTGGWDPLGIDLQLHLGIVFPVGLMRSDVAGIASRPFWLPSSPWSIGRRVHLQSVWMADAGSGDTCSPALYDLASSRGLTITIQP